MQGKEILEFWFGHVEETVVPSKNRARVWFGDSMEADQAIKDRFSSDLQYAITSNTSHSESPHDALATIIVLDQFSRHVYHGTADAFAQDAKALSICEEGMQNRQDHQLSLIERVFYYYPLLHAENLQVQENSLAAYQLLAQMAIDETKVLYDSFLRFAMHHYDVVRQFGRFPQRNKVLGRESTAAELIYLKELESE